jgi:D-alanine-D-alanine ligase
MTKVGLIFGGMSNEHEVSVISAKNIVKNFDYEKYQLVLLFWDKNGIFYLVKDIENLGSEKQEIKIEEFKKYFDVALPMTHGKYGEDGVLQGILESQKIKYCGCRVLASALCMDKGLFKQLLSGFNVNQVKFEIIDFNAHAETEIENIISKVKKMSLPVFIKPANSGSSVGISKVKDYADLSTAILEAQKHDSRIIIEAGVNNAREIEIAVLGNKELRVSEPGELIPVNEFYDYEDKYKLNMTKLEIPAKLDDSVKNKIQKIAESVYQLCGCQGFARVDFFVVGDDVYLNEINTLPGFTSGSMYPLMMMQTGLGYKELINEIIGLAY